MLYISRKQINQKIGLSGATISKIFNECANKDQKKHYKRKKIFTFSEAVDYFTIFSGSQELSRKVVNQIFMDTYQIEF